MKNSHNTPYRYRKHLLAAVFWISHTIVQPAVAQTVAPAFADDYSLLNLGSISGVPTNYGGLTFLDNNHLLIGGAANTSNAAIYRVPVNRDAEGGIIGFGTVTQFATATGSTTGGIDGGLTFGPGGVLFYTVYNSNELAQIMPGNTGPDKHIGLTALGVASSVGGMVIVPSDQPGAGKIKLLSYNASR